ncbi:MAG: T9SS type A sorting domain-containing protein [Chitinophagales bacterium]|nr:T9SS type A sorting domain-containing protein [Bacteroidota bacterium]MCB9042688.1 T9SS type A sorting domain-containing protein [Chitinophagales bacterium]
MKKFLLLCSFLGIGNFVFGQCPPLTTLNLGTPSDCTTAPNILPYYQECRKLTMNSATAGWGIPQQSQTCGAGVVNHDLYVQVPTHPVNVYPNFDGSLVLGLCDYPGYPSNPPTIAAHFEADGCAVTWAFGCLAGNLTIDCANANGGVVGDGPFLQPNVICVDQTSIQNNHLVLFPGSVPTLAQMETQFGVDQLDDIAVWIQVEAYNGTSTGNYCFEVSPYKTGFICGDAKDVPLTVSGTTASGSTTTCLCDFAGNGGFFEPGNAAGFSSICPTTTGTAAWYHINVPFTTSDSEVAINIPSPTQNYNMALISGLVCPDETSQDLAGNPVTNPGDVVTAYTVEASACGSSLTSGCLPAGDYWIVVSGQSTKSNFTLNVNVTSNCVTCGVQTFVSPSDNLVSTNDAQSGTEIYASNSISGTYVVEYVATDLISMGVGFQATIAGAGYYEASIDPAACGALLNPVNYSNIEQVFSKAQVNLKPLNINVENTSIIQALSPNPANDVASLQIKATENTEALVEIYDVTGRLMYSVYDEEVQANQLQSYHLPLAELSAGVYMVKVRLLNGEQQSMKLLKR